MVCPATQKQPTIDSSTQHETSAGATNEMQAIKDILSPTQLFSAPFVAATKTLLEMPPKLMVSWEMFQCTVDDIILHVKKAKAYYSHLQK